MKEFLKVSQECGFFKLRKASRAVTRIYEQFMQPVGLKPTQFSLLTALSVTGKITISQLAETMVMDRTTLTRNLKPIEKEGLIEIVPGIDRRTRTILLTAKGRRTLAEALPLWGKAQAHMAEKLGAQRWNQLRESLDTTAKIT